MDANEAKRVDLEESPLLPCNVQMTDRDEQIQHHAEVLMDTQKLAKMFMSIVIFTSFAFASRVNISVLYARTFTDDLNYITIIIYVGSIFYAIIAFVGSSYANSYGFDKVAMIEMIFFWIGVCFESIAWDIESFGVGYVISRQSMPPLVLGFIAYMLPLVHSKQYTAIYYEVYIVAYLFGPTVSGVLSYLVSYRAVFILNAISMFCAMIFTFLYVYNKQKPLELKQLSLKNAYLEHSITQQHVHVHVHEQQHQKDTYNETETTVDNEWLTSEDHRFPLCLYQLKTIDDDQTNTDDAYNGKFSDISRYQWFLLVNIILQYGIILANESIVATWYTVYMEDKFKANIIISTTQLVAIASGMIIGMEGFRWIVKKMQKNSDNVHALVDTANMQIESTFNVSDSTFDSVNSVDSNSNNIDGISGQIHANSKRFDICNFLTISSLTTYVCCMFISGVMFPKNVFEFDSSWYVDDKSIGLYMVPFYIYAFLYGIMFGILLVSVEMMLLDVQPKQIAGYVAGAKSFVLELQTSLGVLVIGFMWNVSYEWLFYFQAVSYGVGMVLMIMVVVCEQSVKSL